jgi:hypothetical protein
MMEIEDPDILKAIQRHVKSLHRFVTDAVRRAQEEGWVSRAFSPEITAWTLLHLGLGYGIFAPLGIEDHAVDQDNVHVRDVIEQMMLGEKARKRQDEMLEQRERDGH